MRKLMAATLVAAGLTLGAGLLLWQEPVIFRSLESTTESRQPIFNRMRFVSGWRQDLWLMQQSQSGYNAKYETWDRERLTFWCARD